MLALQLLSRELEPNPGRQPQGHTLHDAQAYEQQVPTRCFRPAQHCPAAVSLCMDYINHHEVDSRLGEGEAQDEGAHLEAGAKWDSRGASYTGRRVRGTNHLPTASRSCPSVKLEGCLKGAPRPHLCAVPKAAGGRRKLLPDACLNTQGPLAIRTKCDSEAGHSGTRL